MERKDIGTQGEREGSIAIYTVPCANIGGERLLCSTGDQPGADFIYIYIIMTDSRCCMAETNSTL